MFHRWAALVLVLALCAMSPKNAAGQTQSKPREPTSAGKLGRNYPNPFNPETTQPFDVAINECTDGSRQHVVSLQVFNVLMQPIATLVLMGAPPTSTTNVPPELISQPIRKTRLGCGSYLGFWNGFVDGSRKEAASGTYLMRLTVDGKSTSRLIFLSK